MMYSAYKLNKQGDNIEPYCTPFPIWKQSVFPYQVLTVASWPAYRFLKRQDRWSGIPISFRISHSLLWSTKLVSILKSRDITLPTMACLVKVMVFPIAMRGCESWIVRKAECRKTDAFELWCWRRLLRVPWTARRSNQSILKEISPGYLLEA